MGLDKKMATTSEGSSIPPPPSPTGKAGKRTTPVAAPEANIEVEEVPEEHIFTLMMMQTHPPSVFLKDR